MRNYFSKCDQRVAKSYSQMYTYFLQQWATHKFPDWASYDCINFWFNAQGLTKVTVVKDTKIIFSEPREVYLTPTVNLDVIDQTDGTTNEFIAEYVANEATFMKYINLSPQAITLTDRGDFLVSLYIGPKT